MAYKFQLGNAVMSGALEQEEGITISAGGLSVTAGGISVTAGALGLNNQGITSAGSIAGASTVVASGKITGNEFATDGDEFTVSTAGAISGSSAGLAAVTCIGLNAQSAGISNAGAIAGATTVAAAGLANLNGGIEIDNGGNKFTVSTAGAVVAASSISGSGAGSFGSMTLDGALALQSAGITAAGAIAGATSVSGSGAGSFGSMTLDGALALQSAGITAAGSIAGATTIDGSGDLSMGTITMTGFSVDADGDTSVKSLSATNGAVSGSGGFSAGGGLQATGDVSGSGQFYSNGMVNANAGVKVLPDKSIMAANLSSGLKFEADGDIEFHDGNYSFDIASHDGSTYGLQLAGTLVTSTAANLNRLAAVTPGTVAASKALVVDASRDLGSGVDGINNLFLDGNLDADGTLTIDGLATLNGSVKLGNASGDLIGISGSLGSDLIPDVTSQWDLGSSSKYFDNIYVNTIHGGTVTWDVEKIASSGQTIASTSEFALMGFSDGNVTLPAASAGKAVRIKLSGSSENVQVNAGSGDTIEDAANILLESKGAAVTCISFDGQAWFVI